MRVYQIVRIHKYNEARPMHGISTVCIASAGWLAGWMVKLTRAVWCVALRFRVCGVRLGAGDGLAVRGHDLGSRRRNTTKC